MPLCGAARREERVALRLETVLPVPVTTGGT